MKGTVDLFHSRKDNYEECLYWVRDERKPIGDASKFIYNKTPSGVFFARQSDTKINQPNVVNGVWMFGSNTMTIKTEDDVIDLKRGCIVKAYNEIWLVTNVQQKIHLKESMFNVEPDYTYYISLSKGD